MFVDCITKLDLDNYNKENWSIDYSKILDLDDLPGEIWKDVGIVKNINFNGLYKISNFGRIKSCGCTTLYKSGYYYTRKEKILKQETGKAGYKSIKLHKEKKTVKVYIHKLVADIFLHNNIDNKTEVNHINEVKFDNTAENLEWCTREYNINYGTRTERANKKIKIPVVRCQKDYTLVKRYDGAVDSTLDGFDAVYVRKCCKKKKCYKGYIWMYEKEYLEMIKQN